MSKIAWKTGSFWLRLVLTGAALYLAFTLLNEKYSTARPMVVTACFVGMPLLLLGVAALDARGEREQLQAAAEERLVIDLVYRNTRSMFWQWLFVVLLLGFLYLVFLLEGGELIRWMTSAGATWFATWIWGAKLWARYHYGIQFQERLLLYADKVSLIAQGVTKTIELADLDAYQITTDTVYLSSRMSRTLKLKRSHLGEQQFQQLVQKLQPILNFHKVRQLET